MEAQAFSLKQLAYNRMYFLVYRLMGLYGGAYTVFIRLNATTFIIFFVIRVRRLFKGGVYLKSNLFLANETVHCENSEEGA